MLSTTDLGDFQMTMRPGHWVVFFLVIFVGYWLGERYGGGLKGIPLIGPYT